MILTPGSTSIIKHVFIQDSTSTSGAGKTGLLYSGVTAYYIRAGGSITALTMETISTIGTWASTGDNYLGMKLVNDTNMPGLYELDLPNNILVAGANQVTIMIKGTGIAPCNIEIQLKDVSNLSAILGTALTETSAGYLSAGVKKVFDVATPVFTAASLNQSKDVVTALTDLKLDKLIAAAGADTDVTDNSLLTSIHYPGHLQACHLG